MAQRNLTNNPACRVDLPVAGTFFGRGSPQFYEVAPERLDITPKPVRVKNVYRRLGTSFLEPVVVRPDQRSPNVEDNAAHRHSYQLTSWKPAAATVRPGLTWRGQGLYS